MTKEEIRAVAMKRRAAEKYQFRLAFQKAGFPDTPELAEECPEAEFQPLPEGSVDYSALVVQLSGEAKVSPAMASMPAYHILAVLTSTVETPTVKKKEGYSVVGLGGKVYIIASSPSREGLDCLVEGAFAGLCVRGAYDLRKEGGSWVVSPQGYNQRKYRQHGNWVRREEWPWFVRHFSCGGERIGVFEWYTKS